MDVQRPNQAWRFGPFRLEPGRRTLFAHGKPVALSSRAYDLLELLIRNRERVVTRDEVMAHVWRGLAVGDNNLAVQLSGLRRVLADHSDGEPLIVSLPGRGYQFVGDITDEAAREAASPVVARPQAHEPPRPPRPIWLLAGSLGVLVAAFIGSMVATVPSWRATAIETLFRPPRTLPEARLSVAVIALRPIGDDRRATALAARYTEAVLARFGMFECIGLFVRPEQSIPGFQPHFELDGTIEVAGEDAVLTVGLTEKATGRQLFRDTMTIAAVAPAVVQLKTAMQVLNRIRPLLFAAEAAMRHGRPPRDALDFLIDAHVALSQQNSLAHLQQARALAQQAAERDPSSRPARALLSTLLTEDMLATSAQRGNAEGERALSLIDAVLLEQPLNFVYIGRRAYTLAALDRLDEAEATAERGLGIAPQDQYLSQELGEILIANGNLAKSRALLEADLEDPGDDTMATLAFAEGRLPESLQLCRQVLAHAPQDWLTRLTLLLEISTLSQLGKQQEAKSVFQRAVLTIPDDLRSVSSLRQASFVLPNESWKRFKAGLVDAGMKP